MPGCFRIFAYLAFAALAVAAVLVFFATRPDVGIADLGEVTASESARIALNERLDAIDQLIHQSKTTGVASPVELQITEQELTSKVGEFSVEAWFLELAELQTHLKEDTIILLGRMRIAGLDFRFRGDVRIRIESGEWSVELARAQVGQMYLPGPVRNAVAGMAARSVDAGLPRPPIEVESLFVSEGSLVLSGSTRS